MIPLMLSLLIVALLLMALHYFHWERFIGGRLPRLAAYSLGVAAFVVPWSVLVWQVEPPARVAVVWLLACVGVAGTVTGLTWLADWLADKVADAKTAKEWQRELAKRMDQSGAND